ERLAVIRLGLLAGLLLLVVLRRGRRHHLRVGVTHEKVGQPVAVEIRDADLGARAGAGGLPPLLGGRAPWRAGGKALAGVAAPGCAAVAGADDQVGQAVPVPVGDARAGVARHADLLATGPGLLRLPEGG